MKKKLLIALLILLLAGAQSVFACTIFAVGKDATVDGSTITSHTCDSTGDDLRLWVIPSMEAGTERDVVLNGRAGADYSAFPEVKDYGDGGMVLGTYTFDKPSNQYLHAMYSFINDKGLAMGESTCVYDWNSDHGKKLREIFSRDEGIYDCYMLQDLALETCSTAREAVEFMGALVEEYGWNGWCECINICDGNEAWVMEIYGGKIWVAVRVPDNAVFVAANRARINQFDFNDTENYKSSKNIKEFAINEGLWDGKGDFVPCRIFCPFPGRTYSTRREWIAMMTLDPSLNLDANDPDHDFNWPLFVVPQEKVSVETIHRLSSNYYQGTEYDLTHTLAAGPFGNPLYPAMDRSINCYRCTYIQIANVKAYLPEEVRCLAYFGWGAPDSTYLTPVFASQKSLPEQFGIGVRNQYDERSGWWLSSEVQQLCTVNYVNAIEDLHALRDPLMAKQYQNTALIQNMAAKMVKDGNKDAAIDLLTAYSTQQSLSWFADWKALKNQLTTTYMHSNKNMKTQQATEWWQENVTAKGLK